jgi:CRISPR/Cas system Type II protein with McrA/HNH and RuvC-like nuclease domain
MIKIKKATPGPDWYRRMNELRVEMDLEKTNLKEKLGCEIKHFIKFAGKQRFNYEEDIYAEFKEFQNRKKRLYEIDVKLYYQIRTKVLKRDDYTCQYCGEVGGKLEVDHMQPFSRGGKATMNNLITSCRKCNGNKSAKTPEEAGLSIINDPRK